ncbi:MTH938/NDUFAF3 family protein [uncultured Cohaesibacter sp.]|uniref:Mth938-like domain-containing protein n=1 Tax=uncultured Cohaesibacter sp. TaxID=1002546 RepID=UPI00292F706A|nr:MTH938/NDUFAF3 family protein [uncultured Cohaesibacter sp.]
MENAVALASGVDITDAHYPGRDPIDYYGNGGFRFSNMSHRGALLVIPSGIHRWDVDDWTRLDPESFSKIFAEKDDIEILLIGTGNDPLPLDPSIADALRKAEISFDIMTTGAAVRTLNILLSEDRAVAAALLPVA